MEKPVNRKFYFSQQFEQDSTKDLIKSINDVNDKDDLLEKEFSLHYNIPYTRKPIEIYIDSYGGNVYQCLGLIDIVGRSKTPVHTIVTGCAMSAGFILLISGHKRFAHKNSTVLYHQVSSATWGTVKFMEEKLEESKRLNKLLKEITMKKTNIPKSKIKEYNDMKSDWYMDSTQALEYGIIDEILT